jgi:hypothetical protein
MPVFARKPGFIEVYSLYFMVKTQESRLKTQDTQDASSAQLIARKPDFIQLTFCLEA